MRILVVSCSPWRDDNNIGNSYTNIFEGMTDVEVAHICCGSGIPSTDFVKRHFHISEKNILKNLFGKDPVCGKAVHAEDASMDLIPIGGGNGFFDFMRKYRLMIFFWIRDFIWSFGNWKDASLKCFVDDFKPDLIFAIFLDTGYLNKMLLFLKEYTGKPLVLYAWDDVYSFKQFSFSPLFWINRLVQRRGLRKVAKQSSRMYTISSLQKDEYTRTFKKDGTVLYKGYSFEEKAQIKAPTKPLKMVFTGNISSGRWKTLSEIGKALQKLNESVLQIQLFLYTSTPMTNKMKKALDFSESVVLMGSVPAREVPAIQAAADVLVHVESFSLKDLLQVRLSFSTKLVDYFLAGKCIFAVGPKEVSSMDYLTREDAALCVTERQGILAALKSITEDPQMISAYAQKAWECGRRNHQIEKIQRELQKDFRKLKGDLS